MSEPEQQNQERNYIAFISYRHKPLDKEAVKTRIQERQKKAREAAAAAAAAAKAAAEAAEPVKKEENNG